MRQIFLLLEDEFCASIGHVGSVLAECKYFPAIPRLNRLPACAGELEIGWWLRDWIGITCSWLMCTHQHFGDGQLWGTPVGTLRRFDDLFIDPTADFIL